uniref:Uncharacterized protein n=1 Tax=Romanomermis culicivorax TaxID=13658 RepID=A0A915JU20_ROMCU
MIDAAGWVLGNAAFRAVLRVSVALGELSAISDQLQAQQLQVQHEIKEQAQVSNARFTALVEQMQQNATKVNFNNFHHCSTQ